MTRDEAVVVLVAYFQTRSDMTFPDWPSFREATKMMSEEAKTIHDRENKVAP